MARRAKEFEAINEKVRKKERNREGRQGGDRTGQSPGEKKFSGIFKDSRTLSQPQLASHCPTLHEKPKIKANDKNEYFSHMGPKLGYLWESSVSCNTPLLMNIIGSHLI